MTEKRLKLDLHMHSTVSDGTDSPAQLIEIVAGAGIDIFSLTDHDGVAGCAEIRGLLAPGDSTFLTGVEFSCRDEEGKYHILGYGYDPDSPSIRAVVELGHGYRVKKMNVRLDHLRREFGFVFPEEEIEELFALPNPGKPHLANMMIRHGFARTRNEAIGEYIDSLHVKNTLFVRPEEAIRGVLGAGGIPVLAHPCFGDGNDLILGAELERRVDRLIGFGLQGLEAYYSDFSADQRAQVLSIAEKNSLYVTAGSDYHGKNKPISPGETGLDVEEYLPDGLLRFLEDTKSV